MNHTYSLWDNEHLDDLRIGYPAPRPTHITEIFLATQFVVHKTKTICDLDSDNDPIVVLHHPTIYYGQTWLQCTRCNYCYRKFFQSAFGIALDDGLIALTCPQCWYVWTVYEQVN